MSTTVTPLTLFAVPKPFEGHIGVIQHNAIGSWTRLGGQIDVVLCGVDAGDAAAELGVRHLPDLERNEHGTPLLSSVFPAVRDATESPLLAYANSDMILMRDFARAVERLPLTHLMAGRRWDVDLTEELDFDGPWERQVRHLVETEGVRAAPEWIDYFVFARESPLVELPPFIVGRPRWDNWMIYRARSLRIPVVDATEVVDAVHQGHDYSHVPSGSGLLWYGPEADANAALAGETPMLSIDHATHVMTSRGIRRATDCRYVKARWEMRHAVNGDLERFARGVDRVLGPVRRIVRG